jgi:hypothetical protein
MTERVVRKAGLIAVLVLATGALGCSKTVRDGRSPAYLIIESLEASAVTEAGETASDFSGELSSDVLTNGGIFEDLGEVTFRLALKDIGSPENPTAPTSNNFITVNRYRVEFRRTDGRNTPGVDVPYPFEGAATVTVGAASQSMIFVLVRVQSKAEPPLINLAGGGGAFHISSIADVTFYGRDQVGNDVVVSGSISVNFGDWADPDQN